MAAETPERPLYASTSSSISLSRASLPDRPGSAEPSPRNWAGWLQTCLSLASVARISPRRSMPSAASSGASNSRSTAR